MRGMFELFTGHDASYRFQLTAPDGTVMAVSRPFPDKRSAIAGIAAVREYAGMGLVTELPAGAALRQASAVQVLARSGAASRTAQDGAADDGASEAAVRRPRFRIPSAAYFLGRRAAARNPRAILRWRQIPKTGTTPAQLSPC